MATSININKKPTYINVVENYAALPPANLNSGQFYWVKSSTGTKWLPGNLGGNYRQLGLYYSNGTTWTFTPVPNQATQAEVDAGIINDKFVTPLTLKSHIETFGDVTPLDIGEEGIELAGVTSEPTAPTTSKIKVYGKFVNGRSTLKVKGPNGLDTPLQNALYQNSIWIVSPNVTSSVSAIGGAVASFGTISTITPSATSYGLCTNFATTVVANSTAGTGSTTLPLNLSSGVMGGGGFSFVSRLWFPDANYGTGVTGTRVFIGATNQTMAISVGSDNPIGYRIGFGLSTVLLETEFMLTTKNNITETRVSTGVTFLSNKLYDFYLTVFPGGTIVYWRIDNLTDGTSTEGTTTSTLPIPTIYMRAGFQIATLTTTIRNVRMKKVYVETDN